MSVSESLAAKLAGITLTDEEAILLMELLGAAAADTDEVSGFSAAADGAGRTGLSDDRLDEIRFALATGIDDRRPGDGVDVDQISWS